MKKLTEKQRLWQIKHAEKKRIHKIRRKFRGRYYIPLKKIKLPAPQHMDLDKSETLIFLNRLRECADNKRESFRIDFTKIKSITPSCALVFATELNRFSLVRGGKSKLRVVDFDKWDENIKYLLRDMGMFELLNIQNIPNDFMLETHENDTKFFKFITDNSVNGNISVDFRNTVSSVIAGVPNEKKLQIAVSESMDNVLYHGYPNDFLEKSVLKDRRWWLSASYNKNSKELNFMFFDHGIGIPQSLPRVHPGLFGSLVSLFDDDDKKIEAATKAGRSSTKQKHRGRGLPQIISYVRLYDKDGFVKITSGKGVYKFIKKTGVKAETKLYTNQHDIHGTLIEWQICL